MNEAQPTTTDTQPPVWYWIVSGIALAWNLVGLVAFIAQVLMNEAALAELPDEQRELYENIPLWATIAFGVAVVAGVMGCIFLLMRKNWALPTFVVSIVAVLVQNFQSFILNNVMEVMGPTSIAGPVVVLTVGGLLIWLSIVAVKSGWMK